MQSRDHRMLAEFLADKMGEEIPCIYKKAFILGNIEPDRNLFTYLHGLRRGQKFHGHNYENILSVMRTLFDSVQKQELFGIWSYYRLGKLTHYVADVFTFPHNREFCGNLKEHRRYEGILHEQISDALQRQKNMAVNRKGAADFRQIEALHRNYLKEAGTCVVDCQYILEATAMLLKDETQMVWCENVASVRTLAG